MPDKYKVVQFAVASFSLFMSMAFLIAGGTNYNLVLQEGSRKMGSAAMLDAFETTDDGGNANLEITAGVLGESRDPSVIHKYSEMYLPLTSADYYNGKYTNARAATAEINATPALGPGARIRLIADGYLTLNYRRGYVKSDLALFASGVCWSTSAVGGVMDVANRRFRTKYGMDLFLFGPGDRAPHGHTYGTYRHVNNGYGYAIYKPRQDFRFSVNPNIAAIPGLADLKIEIVMVAQSNYPGANRGQMIGAQIYSNKEFLTHSFVAGNLGPTWSRIQAGLNQQAEQLQDALQLLQN